MNIFHQIVDAQENRAAVAFCTVIETRGSTPRHGGSKMLVFEDGRISGTVGGGEIENRVIQEARQSLADGRARVLHYDMIDPGQGDPGICGGQVDVYVEPVLPQPELVVIGGGHVGKAVARLGKFLGFRVIVADDRPEFCTKEANPDADDFVLSPMQDLPKLLKITPRSYLVLTTRGMAVDVPGLPAILNTPAAYIGVIGSKRRWTMTRKSLAESGIAEEWLERVHSPIGLELNAETPEEIAVSILAEIILIRNGGSGASMRMKK